MKNKYQRMTKEEKKEIYLEFKKEKKEFTKKMERMMSFCKLGIIFTIFATLFDIFAINEYKRAIVDGILMLFCILMLIKTNNVKVELLNKFSIEKDKKLKKDLVKKYKKNIK